MGKAFEFYALYNAKDWDGLLKLACESVVGGVKGDALFSEIKPILDKFTKGV